MLLAVPTFCPNYAQIMQLVLEFIPFCKMSDRVAILSWCHKLLFYCILLCLGYGVWLCLLVLVWSLPASYRAAWLTPFGKLANERYCDQHHLATSGPVISCQTASLRGKLSLPHQNANAAKTLNKKGLRRINIYRLCQQCYFLKIGENYVSTINKSLLCTY